MNNSPVVFITGATSDIGMAIANKFAAHGYNLIITGRKNTLLQSIKEKITKEHHVTAHAITADLCDRYDITNIVNKINNIGRIDVFIHCASVWHSDEKAYFGINYEDYQEDLISDTMDVTLNSFMTITYALTPLFKKQNSGSIIAITGTFENGANGWLPYYTAKQSLEIYCKGLSDELFCDGIQVNCISPSDTNTTAYRQFFPDDAKNGLDPNEISDFALFLASEKAKHITGSCTVLKKY